MTKTDNLAELIIRTAHGDNEDLFVQYVPECLGLYAQRAPEGLELHLYVPREKVKDILNRLRLLTEASGLEVKPYLDRDWLTHSRQVWKPIRAGRFVVHPVWLKPRKGMKAETVIFIEPNQAFGTGLHPSTQLILRWISKANLNGKTILDLGTGTGILAIAAVKAGALKAIAVDRDEQAIRECKTNIKDNGVEGGVFVIHGTIDCVREQCVDIALANLEATEIRRNLSALRAVLRKRGILVLGGFMMERKEEVKKWLADEGFQPEDMAVDSGWVLMVSTKTCEAG